MIVIHKAEYVASAVKYEQYPAGDAPEIALAGRSNVGKSSLINSFLGRRNLAFTGNTPGKTQTLNFYRVNDLWFFVDLPGYGYAKVSKTVNANWRPMIENYLKRREQLRAVIQVVDMRHEPSSQDVDMQKWLREMGIPTLVVATKADKVSVNEQQKAIRLIKKTLHLTGKDRVIAVSALKKTGYEELLKEIELLLEE